MCGQSLLRTRRPLVFEPGMICKLCIGLDEAITFIQISVEISVELPKISLNPKYLAPCFEFNRG